MFRIVAERILVMSKSADGIAVCSSSGEGVTTGPAELMEENSDGSPLPASIGNRIAGSDGSGGSVMATAGGAD